MTEIRTNLLGRYSSQDIKEILEENRVLDMRWQVFEGLYDTTRQELEKLNHVQNENMGLTAAIPILHNEIDKLKEEIENWNKTLSRVVSEKDQELEALHKLADEAVLENEKLHKQIALYIDLSNDVVNPLKELGNETVKEPDLLSVDRKD